MNPESTGSLEEQVGELRLRVGRLEEALRRQGVLQKDFIDQPVAESAAATPAGAPQVPWTDELKRRKDAVAGPEDSKLGIARPEADLAEPVAAPSFGYAQGGYAQATPEEESSLESRIGSHWFNRIGILAMLIGAAWFLKLAMDNHWIGPLGRVLIGLIAGAGFIVWSERFRSRGYAGFSYSLKAVGSGTLYLSLWAAFSLYQLAPAGAAFAAMILVTAFNGLMSWLQDAELLALYAIAGGLATPLLVSTGGNHEVTLFTYLLILDIAVLVLVALRPWSRLLFVAYAGTVILVAAWWFSYYSDAQFARTAFFVGYFFLCFAFAPRLVRVDLEDGAAHSGWDSLAMVVLPIANAAIGFIAFFNLFDHFNSDWAGAWLAVGFAAFYLVLLRLPAVGRLRASPPLLSALHLTAAVVFLTIAIPLKTRGRWLTIGWLAEGAALLWMASRLGLRLLRVLALLCLALGFIALVVNFNASITPIFNERFGSYCVAIAVFGFAAWIAGRAKREGETAGTWPLIAGGAVLTMNFLVLLAVSLEIYSYWWLEGAGRTAQQWQQDEMYAQFTYSAWFMLFGAILLAVGFWRRSAFLRWQALVLLAVTIGKVFLADMSQLSQGYRIVSFLGLGALLLAVSFVYQRDLLKLRASKAGGDEA
jgi:uncharacterized membrane protein